MHFVLSRLRQASLALFVLVGSAHSPAQAASTSLYSLEVSGKRLGQVSITSSRQSGGNIQISQKLAIKASGFWGKIDIESQLEETISRLGVLLNASNRLRENNKIYWTRIDLTGTEYLAFRAQMKNTQEKDLEELGQLAKGAVSVLVPGAGDVLEVASIVMSDEKSQAKHDRFTKDKFDTSLMGLPFAWQRNNYALPATLNIFDTQEMAIFKAKVQDLGTATVSMPGNARISARHYRLKIKGESPLDIWLFRSSSGTPGFARVAGKEDGDPFRINLLSVNER